MNRRQENKHNMHVGVQTFVKDQMSVLSTLPDFGAVNARFDASVEHTKIAIRGQELDIKGSTVSKRDAQNTAIGSMMELSANVVAFALVGKKDKALAQAAKINSTTTQMGDSAMYEKFEGVYDLAEAHMADAAAYNVTPALLQRVREDLDRYERLLQVPENSIDKRAVFTRQIDEGQAATSEILKEMDALVKMLKVSNETVCDDYFRIRKIRDLGRGYLSMMIAVKHADTGEGLAAARIELLQQTGEEGKPLTNLLKQEKRSGRLGGARVKNLPAGTYLIRVSKAGFETQEMTVYVNEGEMTRVEVVLEELHSY
jgi:hypothetical protein